MHFIIPVLSLCVLIASSLWWVVNRGLHDPVSESSDMTSFLMTSLPYVFLSMVVLQVLSLLWLVRQERKAVRPDHIEEFLPDPVIVPEKMNTEWVLDALAGGVIVANLQGKVTYMNASAEKLTLWQRHKVMGEPVENVLNLVDLQGNPVIRRVFETHRIHQEHSLQFGQVQLHPRIGDTKFVELHTTCILDDCKAVVFIFRDVTADRKIINRLYRQASRDPLTDLMNRSSFEQYVEQLARDTSTLTRSHVLASVDLDNFKTINDTCGHLAGDELLKQVAQIFRHFVRTSDQVARIGGDEFAVFLEGCSQDKGRSIMESILKELRHFRFTWEGRVFSIGASIGLLEFTPASHIQIKQLFVDADRACYAAKALGRNQVFVHAHKAENEAFSNQRVADWGQLLKDAIRQDRFMLFIQPITPLNKKCTDGIRQYEVLLRLPFRQALLNPGSFLPMADRLDLMVSIDRWIIRKSLETLAKCCSSTQPVGVRTRLMINLSSHTLKDAECFAYVEQQIKRTGVNPDMICFEISESAAISNFVNAKRIMNALHSLGCHWVLDDFGSGFSSLHYLRELPLSYLKVDGNFVHNLVSNPVDAAMVKAVHEVGQVMNLLTIAELVEDAQTLDCLRQIGVDFAQGYYCGRPVPLMQLCQQQEQSVHATVCSA